MATVWPDPRWQLMPDDNACNYQRPLSGTTLAGVASITNHLIGVRCRRAVHKSFGLKRDPFGTGQNQEVWWRNPQGVSETYRVTWTSNRFARHLCVTFLYQAGTFEMNASDKLNVAVDATLASLTAGSDIDAPAAAGVACRWSLSEGTLGMQAFDFGQDTADARVQWGVQVATTGDAIRDISPPWPNQPRPLVVPSSRAGDVLELRLETTFVRILAVDVWEIAEASITA